MAGHDQRAEDLQPGRLRQGRGFHCIGARPLSGNPSIASDKSSMIPEISKHTRLASSSCASLTETSAARTGRTAPASYRVLVSSVRQGRHGMNLHDSASSNPVPSRCSSGPRRDHRAPGRPSGPGLRQVGGSLQGGHRQPDELPVRRLGGGIKVITAKTVDFGARTTRMKGPDLDKERAAAVSGRDRRHRRSGEPAGRAAGPDEADRRTARRHLSRRGHQMGRREDRLLNPGVKLLSSAITLRSTARTRRARRPASPTTSRRFKAFKSEIGAGKTVNWKAMASAARATPAWPRTSPRSTARSATWNTRTPSRTR